MFKNLCYPEEESNKRRRNPVKRALLIFIGTISLGFAIIGIFLPLLPTTPFLLLTAACYLRSSERLYAWLTNHKLFGKYIRSYVEGKGISVNTKLFALALLWASIIYTAFFAVPTLIIQIILLIIAASVTVHIIRIPTSKKTKDSSVT
jgi:uncharacterized protein